MSTSRCIAHCVAQLQNKVGLIFNAAEQGSANDKNAILPLRPLVREEYA